MKRIRRAVLPLTMLPLLGATLIDPTRPPGADITSQAEVAGSPLQLTAVFIYPYSRMAIINGKTVRIGEHIGDFTVTSIEPFAVELTGTQDNKEVLLLVPTVKSKR